MAALIVILTVLYVVGGIMWALNYGMEWSDANSRHDNQGAREAQEAARKFLATPIWPVIAFNSLVKMINDMKERV